MPSEEEKQHLRERRQAILSDLVELAARDRPHAKIGHYRAAAQDLTERLHTIDRMLDFLGAPTGRFAQIDKPIEAIVMLLEEADCALRRKKLVDMLRKNGLPKSVGAINQSIGVQTYAPGVPYKEKIKEGRRLKVIEEPNYDDDLIGLYSWDDSKFESSPNSL